MTDSPGDPVPLRGRDELLWRNVHPSFLDGDRPSSQAFRPTSKDAARLSTARASKVMAADHYDEYTHELGLASAGVWAIAVGEALDLDLSVEYDAESTRAPDPCPTGHTTVDFGEHTGSRVRKAASRLRDHAVERGRQHP